MTAATSSPSAARLVPIIALIVLAVVMAFIAVAYFGGNAASKTRGDAYVECMRTNYSTPTRVC